MSSKLYGRSLLSLRDYAPQEVSELLELAEDLKKKKRAGVAGALLQYKNIVLVFEKASTRTRCAFEVAAFDEGARVTYLTNSQMGNKESLEDTARVLGRYYDGIGFRGYGEESVEALIEHSGIPVWNGLTNYYHPTQALADALTLKEHLSKPFNKMKLCYVGDARSNVANSLMIISSKLGIHFTAVGPASLHPDRALVEEAVEGGRELGCVIDITEDPAEGVVGADAIYTDVWVSMGEEAKTDERIELLRPYQVDGAMMAATGSTDTIFLHCLPAFHDLKTSVAKKLHESHGIAEMEVTDEVFRSPASKVFEQAENRIHTIKAVMCATAGR